MTPLLEMLRDGVVWGSKAFKKKNSAKTLRGPNKARCRVSAKRLKTQLQKVSRRGKGQSCCFPGVLWRFRHQRSLLKTDPTPEVRMCFSLAPSSGMTNTQRRAPVMIRGASEIGRSHGLVPNNKAWTLKKKKKKRNHSW